MVAFVFVLTAVGQALMILTLHHDVHNYASAILPGWVVIGFGLGFTVPTIIWVSHRRHQARARWYHHRTRLVRELTIALVS